MLEEQLVRTDLIPPFHGSNRGSNPRGDAITICRVFHHLPGKTSKCSDPAGARGNPLIPPVTPPNRNKRCGKRVISEISKGIS